MDNSSKYKLELFIDKIYNYEPNLKQKIYYFHYTIYNLNIKEEIRFLLLIILIVID